MNPEPSQLPAFSVVVPSYNRPARLTKMLAGLTDIEYPVDCWEVIVVDDGSQEPLALAVQGVSLPVRVRCVRQDNSGPGVARNTAAEVSEMEYLAFTADDCRPASDWLMRLAAAFKTNGMERAMVGGTVRHALPNELCPTASHLLVEYLKSVQNADKPQFFTPNNLAVHRKTFLEAGGFCEAFGATGEDREFCDRWSLHGYETGFESKAVVDHAHPQSLIGFLKQHFAYGVGSARFRALRDGEHQQTVPESLGFYLRLVLSPIRSGFPGKYRLMVLLLVSQVVNACGALSEQFSDAEDER
ncbi:MAG: glycosyltransferase [Phycisphaera sp.]|nr:MAG: glycosyltransferase [Phycisphaera sp.]